MTRAAMATPITYLAFSEYFAIGIGAVIFAPVLPAIIAEFNLTLATAGLIFPARAVGGLIGGLVAGPLVDRYGNKPIVCTSAALSALGLLAGALGLSWSQVLLGFALLGLGQRALSTSLNTLIARAHPAEAGRYINYLQSVYALGALAAPLVIGALLLQAVEWRTILALPAFLWALFGVLSLLPAYPGNGAGTQSRARQNPHISHRTLLVLLVIVAFCYNGVAGSLLGWVKVYLDIEGRVHPFLATSMISIFYAALAIGRFVCGSLTVRIGDARTILSCAVGAALVYPILIFTQAPILFIPGVFFCGLFLSGLYPTALAIANSAFETRAGTVTGLLSTGMTLGTMLPPWWTGVIAEWTNFQVAWSVNTILVLALLGSALTLARRSAAPPRQPDRVITS